MPPYVHSSALLKRYVDEPDSERCETLPLAEPTWVTGRHTLAEVRRNLPRLLEGEALAAAREQFAADWRRTNVVELDELTCEIAADVAVHSAVGCARCAVTLKCTARRPCSSPTA